MNVEATFVCAQCGSPAARVVVAAPGRPLPEPTIGGGPGKPEAIRFLADQVQVMIDGVGFGGSMGGGETTLQEDALGEALANHDGARLYAIDPEVARFWCRACAASYCGRCWTLWPVYDPDYPGWFEELRGRCPHGHERRIYD